MKVKTSELTGHALDWAVAKCKGAGTLYIEDGKHHLATADYSTDWAQGGPIIEREKIALDFFEGLCGAGVHQDGELRHLAHGPTPLTAAMRCYVASELGDEVDVPDELGS
jgi:hypothetical protein